MNEKIEIQSRQYQFIYLPQKEGEIQYLHSRKVLDIHIDLAFLRNLLAGQGYSEKKIDDHFLLNKCTFFRRAMQINLEQDELIKQIIQHKYTNTFALDFIKCKTKQLILSVFRETSESILKSKWIDSDLNILNNIRIYLENNFKKNLQLKMLSRDFGINEFKLKKGYKEVYGETIFTKIRNLRLNYAYNLLKNTDLDVKDVAYQSGYIYSHHFSNAFFKRYEILPKDIKSK